MKTLFTLLLFGLFTNVVWSQSYSFSVHQQTYQDLQNAYFLQDDTLAPYTLLILSKDYRAFGHDLGDTLVIGVNGFVTTSTVHHGFALDPLIGNYHFPDTNSRISFEQVISPGNNILKVQWKNIGTDGDPADRLNFQLWVYEKDQQVEFHFGPGSSENEFFSGVFLLDPEFTQAQEKVGLGGNPASPVINSMSDWALTQAPANGTLYRFSYLRAGIEKPIANELSVYPNPGTGTFRVDAPGVKEVRAYNNLGREITIRTQEGTYQLENAAPGIYFLHFSMEDGSSARSKITINE
jgi:hypothetical protein